MKTLLLCTMLLAPPSITEIHENGRIQFSVPDGYNNHIRVSVPAGLEDEGRAEANVLLNILRGEHEYVITDGNIEIHLRACSLNDAYGKIRKWLRLFGQSE